MVLVIAIAVGGGGDGSDDDTANGGSETDNTEDVDSSSSNSDNPPQNDVEVAECTTDEFLGPEAVLTITNNSSERSNYIISVSFESEDGSQQFGTGTALLNNLEPGQSATETASSLEDVPDGTPFTCRLVEVDRFSS